MMKLRLLKRLLVSIFDTHNAYQHIHNIDTDPRMNTEHEKYWFGSGESVVPLPMKTRQAVETIRYALPQTVDGNLTSVTNKKQNTENNTISTQQKHTIEQLCTSSDDVVLKHRNSAIQSISAVPTTVGIFDQDTIAFMTVVGTVGHVTPQVSTNTPDILSDNTAFHLSTGPSRVIQNTFELPAETPTLLDNSTIQGISPVPITVGISESNCTANATVVGTVGHEASQVSANLPNVCLDNTAPHLSIGSNNKLQHRVQPPAEPACSGTKSAIQSISLVSTTVDTSGLNSIAFTTVVDTVGPEVPQVSTPLSAPHTDVTAPIIFPLPVNSEDENVNLPNICNNVTATSPTNRTLTIQDIEPHQSTRLRNSTTNENSTTKCFALQWNLRGLRGNIDELKKLINDHTPDVVALQETKADVRTVPNNYLGKQYNLFLKPGRNAYWQQGVGIAIRESIPYEHVQVNSDLQVVAIRIHLPIKMTVISIYVPPSEQNCQSAFNDLLRQFNGPILILGDCNAHHLAWGSKTTNVLGQHIAETLIMNRLIILNDGTPTRIDPATGNTSHLDLAICSESLARKFVWNVLPDTNNSDHFPTTVSILGHKRYLANKNRRWIYDNADWKQYEFITSTCIQPGMEISVDDFTANILAAAEKSIPRTSGIIGKKVVAWWCPEVEEAIKQRRKKLRILRHMEETNPGKQSALHCFQNARAKAKKLIAKAKKESWEKFIGNISPRNTTAELWNTVNILRGKRHHKTAVLKQVSGYTDNPKEIAEELAKYYSDRSATSSYPPLFQMAKEKAERKIIDPHLNTNEVYNADFTIEELLWALDKGRSASTGSDSLGYPMLQRLPISVKTTLLELLNRVWRSGAFPETWKTATIVPIPKPNSTELGPATFRPISLTSCMAKVFERMVNKRLVTELETNGRLDKRQHAFRTGRGTDTFFTELERSLPNTNEHCMIASLDLSKAYDTTWRYGVIRTLVKWRIHGRMLSMIQSFLSERYFCVRVGGILSSRYPLENGVPQGSVLSVTLFLVAIQPIFSVIPIGVDILLYADDILLVIRGRKDQPIRRKLQTAVQAVDKWTKSVGFSISPMKSQTIYCSPNARRDTARAISVNKISIPKTKQLKVLGVTLDRTLSFKPHCRLIKKSCESRLSLLKLIGARTPRAQRLSLLQVGSAIVTSKLLYGVGLTSRGEHNMLNILTPIYNKMVRYASGAYVTSPTVSVMAEAGMLPFELLVIENIANIAIRMIANDKTNETLPLVFRASQRLLENTDETLPRICQHEKLNCSWFQRKPSIVWDVKSQVRAGDPADKVRPVIRELLTNRFQNCPVFYTDGSKRDDAATGAGVYTENGIAISIGLPKMCSVFSAEAYAIKTALSISNTPREIVILSDSASCISAIESMSSRHPWIQQINFLASNKTVHFCWIPGHAGIRGNEEADRLANEATATIPLNIPIPATDAIRTLKLNIRDAWSKKWFTLRDNKLRKVKPDTNRWKDQENAQDQRVLTRLRIGHTRLTHTFLLEKTPAPICECCGTSQDVRHIILECRKYCEARRRNKINDSLQVALSNSRKEEESMLKFLKETTLYTQI